MKNMETGQKMRWIAGISYGALSIYQMLVLRFALIALPQGSIPLVNFPLVWALEIVLMLGAGVMAVWMFASKDFLKPGMQRAAMVATVLVVVFELMSYSSQAEMIKYTLTLAFNSSDKSILELVFILVKVVLLVLAAFFVTSAGEKIIDISEEDAEIDMVNDEESKKEDEPQLVEEGNDDVVEGSEIDAVSIDVEDNKE